MTIDALRNAVHRAPFEAFTIHLGDGHEVHVPHPDLIALTAGGGTAVVTAMQGDGFTVVDIPLITRLEIPAVPRPRRREG